MKLFLKILKWFMIITSAIVVLLLIITYFFIKQDKFGDSPSNEKVELYQNLENYNDGKFQNFSHTPDLAEGYTMTGIMYNFIFTKYPRQRPVDVIPSIKTNIKDIPLEENIMIWFGHSSYYIQLEGVRIIVDPVFSGNASPIPGTTKSFPDTDIYAVDDFPNIDYLFISHDHYDHLDYETITKFRSKIGKVICGLGVGSHFEHWGYEKSQILEKNWNEDVELAAGFTAHVLTARHFSGRGFTRNNTLWASYLLESPSIKIYIGGDSGYDTHFAEIGEKYGPIDISIIENGQYDLAWRYIHTLPDEVIQAGKDLKTKRLFPVHSSKFVLANHPWDEPLIKVSEFNKDTDISLITPIIGEVVKLNDSNQVFTNWWEKVK
jgi:L-ascorbate metabolism protein UlaG (beta-lactamase superfamily)